MPILQITKFYYHYYVCLLMFCLMISGTIYLLCSNFSPTPTIQIIALTISVILYIWLLLYFIYLNKRQEWFIPHHWKNVRKRPRFYCLLIFPLVIIFLFWLNLSGTLPMFYTAMAGKQQLIHTQAQATKNSFKGKISYYLKTPYRSSPIFKISPEQYQRYQNQQVRLQLTIRQSSVGTSVKPINHIQVKPKTTNKEQ